MAYTPGVARVCLAIRDDRERAFTLTIKQNTVAVVTGGTAVLGLGDIGPEAALPVLEGKAMLVKEFANVEAFPVCLATHDVDKIVETVKLIAPGFGGVNLEDIAAPRCFEIEKRLRKELDIPGARDIVGVDEFSRSELSEEYIILSVFNKKVAPAVAEGVARAADATGVARRRRRRRQDLTAAP
jgi:malate dehydrogenase (oxaloacetate-decarboxylating)